MTEPQIRDRLIGGWRLTGYAETADGKTDHPLGEHPNGTILYTPDGYMAAQLAAAGPYQDDDRPDAYAVAYSGSYDVDQDNQTVAHHLQVSVIPHYVGATLLRQVHFDGPDALVLTATERNASGATTTQTVHWARQPKR